jgi:probable F420-dependent oxidoreductase
LQITRRYLDDLDAVFPTVPRDRRVLAALGPKMLELARDHAGGAHPYLMTPEHTEVARAALGDGPLLAPEQHVVLETDRARARAIAREGIATLRLPSSAT